MPGKKRKICNITPNIKLIAKDLICPITLQLFRYPVIASDGFSYEKWSLIKLLESNNPNSPLTRERLIKKYYDNQFLKQMVKTFIEKNPGSETEQFSEELYLDYEISRKEFMNLLDNEDFVNAAKYKNINISYKYYGKNKNWACIAKYIFTKCIDEELLLKFIQNYNIHKDICHNGKSVYYYIFKICNIKSVLMKLLNYNLFAHQEQLLLGLCKNPTCIDIFFHIVNLYNLNPYHFAKIIEHNTISYCMYKNPTLCRKLFEGLLNHESVICHKCLYIVLEKFNAIDIHCYLDKLDEQLYLTSKYPEPYQTMAGTICFSAIESVEMNLMLINIEKGTIIKRIVDIFYFHHEFN